MSKIDIRRAINEHGLSLVQVAHNAGLVPQSIQQAIKGNPTVEKLYTLANAIGCDVVDLFYPTEEELAARQQMENHTQPADMPTRQPSSYQQQTTPQHTDTYSIASANTPQVHFCPHCGTKFQILE